MPIENIQIWVVLHFQKAAFTLVVPLKSVICHLYQTLLRLKNDNLVKLFIQMLSITSPLLWTYVLAVYKILLKKITPIIFIIKKLLKLVF